MKTIRKKNLSNRPGKKPLTFGDLVMATYRAYGSRRAGRMLQFAINSHVIRFDRLSENIAA